MALLNPPCSRAAVALLGRIWPSPAAPALLPFSFISDSHLPVKPAVAFELPQILRVTKCVDSNLWILTYDLSTTNNCVNGLYCGEYVMLNKNLKGYLLCILFMV
jgi:hypothetical protein